MSDANRTAINYKAEVSYLAAITPPLTAGKSIRFAKASLKHVNGYVLSNEISSTRVRSDQLLTDYSVSGNLTGELSAGNWDDWLAAAASGAWTSNVLVNGVLTPSFNLEVGYLDLAQFLLYQGVAVESFAFDITSKQIATVDVAVVGAFASIGAVTNYTTPTAAPTNPVMTPQLNLQSLLIGGIAPTAHIKSMKIMIKNNLRQRDQIASLNPDIQGRGFLEMSGSIDCYFTDNVNFAAYLANTATSIAFTIGGVGVHNYAFVIPNVKWASSSEDVTGINSDVMQTLTWNAFFSTGSGYLFQITRIA